MILQKGSTGNEVRAWQTFLYETPLLGGTPDGLYGADTEQATVALQISEGLTPDGVAGTDTFRAAGFDAGGKTQLSRTSPGVQDETVRAWQVCLNERGYLAGDVDGDFGLATERATQAFQQASGIAQDGKVGPDTRARAVDAGWKELRESPAAPATIAVEAAPARSTLALGLMDAGLTLPDGWFDRQHEGGMSRDRFRRLANGSWVAPRVVGEGAEVAALQRTLGALGLYPLDRVDGVFGYRTRSAVRLLQLFARSHPELPNPGAPDGVVGKGTQALLDALAGASPEAIWPEQDPDLHARARGLLSAAKDACSADSAWQALLARGAPDTLPSDQWSTDLAEMHVIGLRRPAPPDDEDELWNTSNTDLFLVLARERLWVLFGNTEPSRNQTDRSDPARLVRGQHRYRYGWHKLSDGGKCSYLALRPWSSGVLVGRTASYERIPSRTGISSTINLHWSGEGRTNWSAGCQVVAGRAFLDPRGQAVSCEDFDAAGYSALIDQGQAQTQGAYNLVPDLFLALGGGLSVRGKGRPLRYTLLDDQDVTSLSPDSVALLKTAFERLKSYL